MPTSTRPLRYLSFALGCLLFALGYPLSVLASHTPPPTTVTIPGTLQSELGCSGDWQPTCDKTFLTYDAEDDVWQGTFTVQPGDDQDKTGSRYKAALNGEWTENYGLHAQQGGADIPLVVPQPMPVKFYYDHKTHWVTDNFNSVIAVAVGTFQSKLGCKKDGDPTCLRSWLEDPDGTGVYSFLTTAIPPGTYQVAVALNESNTETYAAQSFTVSAANAEVYMGYNPATQELLVSTEGAPRGNLGKQLAHWVSRDTVLWNTIGSPKYRYELRYAPGADLHLAVGQLAGGESLPLTFTSAGPGATVLDQFPYLAGYTALKLDPAALAQVSEILRGQVAVVAYDAAGKLLDATALQIPGVLDDLYHYAGPLGINYSGDVPTLRLWAPTARAVTLHLFADSTTPTDATFPMAYDATTGVWSVTGQSAWTGQFYLYEVEVYVPSTGKIEHNLVTDPYSLGLSMNSTRSQIVNLADASLTPPGWDTLAKPPLAAPEDSVIYELHIRDFSANDSTVPAAERGTFKAFTEFNSNGMKHLKTLAQAGLTHVHLLPAFDIASIDEDKSHWQSVNEPALANLPPDSDQQQAAVAAIRNSDPFNWGYDPYHYTTPEGSYATNPDGSARIVEFREMVQALNQIGLRVVMDVVYNHTSDSGQSEKSVLDKVVPGYYYRLSADGQIETSTCCQNTATEHAMMEKLMIDSLVTWAKYYKVDGFRFDLMGHHMLANMVKVRQALDSLTLAQDGVDGKSIYIYGEGWDFGEVAKNARGQNASQLNIAGTGIGVFNDRLRDAARGGGPFDDPREQGFLTGLFDDPNAYDQGSAAAQQAKLLDYMDWIRLGLAGNLKSYEFADRNGELRRGDRIFYNGAPAGYTADPQENIVYVSAHDNETLFDAIQMKAPADATLADRVRMNNLGVSLVMLSQGVPFFHAGDDLLRSKSLDRNSYNSGDWFNKLDFTYQTDNWGVGLPLDSQDEWPLIQPLLANPALKPAPADIQFAAAHFREMLQIRKSSPLFRLQTADEILAHLTFLNTVSLQIPGLIVLRLADPNHDLDPLYSQIVIFFNGNKEAMNFADASFNSLAFELHPVQAASADPVVKQSKFDSANGAFTIPGRTAAVFVVLNPNPQPLATPTVVAAYPVATSSPAGYVPPVAATPAPAPASAAPSTPTGLIVGILAVIALLLGVVFFWQRRAQ